MRDAPGTTPQVTAAHGRPPGAPGLVARGLVGFALLAAPAWVVATAGDVVAHQHRALTVLLVVAALAGVAVLVRVVVLARRRSARAVARTAAAPAAGTGGAVGRRGPASRVLAATGVTVGYLVLALLAGAVVWLRPFAATDDALAALRSDDLVEVREESGWYAFVPQGPTSPTAGLVYSPGARVDVRATAAVLRPLAEAGYLVVALKEPLGVALTSPAQSGQAIAAYPEIDDWAVGGHSLGGVVASTYAAANDDLVDGLLLHASYPMGDISDADLRVASVSGSRDGLTTPADVEASVADLPRGTTFTVVDGAVHAFFADYGPQPGDGEPTVTRARAQQEITTADLALLGSLGD
ncbi:alpha/beta hydrolase [Cellulomonas sp. zg-ZUI22]|uniref:alpha/beta hydrolase n=1 Tax=Cellulomonas sp. zg-ZUI22 TaxID=2816955 RepID=UPI001A93CCF5|nr:alpha/beta hydrolase [Cellulomonas sp. zg-ZUI22]MBO0899248.1 alpha/beta hydrolase [Cellulomonas sp. zg-ZUI22]